MKLAHFLPLILILTSPEVSWAQKDNYKSSFVMTEEVITGFNGNQSRGGLAVAWGRTLGYHRLFSESLELGIEVSYLYFDRADFIPLSLSFGADIFSRQRHKLKIKANLGYTLASRYSQNGMDWGGSHLGVGFEYHLPVSRNGRFFLVFNTNYILQERKFPLRLGEVRSGYRTHFFGSGLGMCFML